jgi:hypothetical protein
MPDTNGGYMLTTPQAQLARTPAAGGVDRTTAILPLRPEPHRRPSGKRMPRPAKKWLGRGVLTAGFGMIPWIFILASTLPPATMASHWPAAWAGLDSLEAVGLITTGVALIRRYSWLCLPAAVTSTLLVVDAWFDVTTSAPGSAAAIAITMAIFPEVPMACLCAIFAVRNAPLSTLRHRQESAREQLTRPKGGAPNRGHDRSQRTAQRCTGSTRHAWSAWHWKGPGGFGAACGRRAGQSHSRTSPASSAAR